MQRRPAGPFKIRQFIVALSRSPVWSITGLAAAFMTLSSARAMDFETATKEAARNIETKAGSDYMGKVAEIIGKNLASAMDVCGPKYSDTSEPGLIAFIVGADGRVTQTMASPGKPFVQCVLSHLPPNISLPRPPRDGWPVAAGVENHYHQVAKSAGASAKDVLGQYDNAIAPYVAEGRATYPAAKKRFLAGLPGGNKFIVRIRLKQGKKIEESFVEVTSIKDGQVTGIINSVDIVTNYRKGQQITVPESEIKDWLIQHRDGSLEGNAVGRFLNQNRR
jgi:uncharacterized protein YegJ (DUF2314 family)